MASKSMLVKIKCPITGSYALKEKKGYIYTGLSINSNYRCDCNCNL